MIDEVFGMKVENNDVFEEMGRSIISKAIEGYNGSLFCYGQTGSGKTHTMYGYSEDERIIDPPNEAQFGLVQLTSKCIFSQIQQTPNREFLLRITFMEIYNESVNDLIQPNNTNLKLSDNAKVLIHIKSILFMHIYIYIYIYGYLSISIIYRRV